MQCLLGSPSINSIHFWSNIKRSTRAPTVTICSVYFDIENRSEGVPVYRNPWIRESRMKCTTIREFVIAGRPARLDLISGKVHVEDGAHCTFTESLDISEAKAPPSKIDHSCVSQAFFLSKCALCKKTGKWIFTPQFEIYCDTFLNGSPVCKCKYWIFDIRSRPIRAEWNGFEWQEYVSTNLGRQVLQGRGLLSSPY